MTDDLDDDDLDVQWTGPARQRLAATAEHLIAAIRQHAATLSHLRGGAAEIATLFDANDAIAAAIDAYDDAALTLTGTSLPFGRTNELDEDDDVNEVTPNWTSGVSVLHRSDYALLDEQRVLAEGRTAYLECWPNETEEGAAARVSGLGDALLEVTHARGLAALGELPGLHHLGDCTVFVATHDTNAVLDGLDHDPSTAFHPRDEVLLRHRNLLS